MSVETEQGLRTGGWGQVKGTQRSNIFVVRPQRIVKGDEGERAMGRDNRGGADGRRSVERGLTETSAHHGFLLFYVVFTRKKRKERTDAVV